MQEMNEVREDRSGKIRSIMKVVAVVLMVMFFFPVCTVSCGSYTMDISASTVTFGVEVMGQRQEGNILFGLLFLIPALILIVLFIKNMAVQYGASLAAAGALADVIFLLVFRSRVTQVAEESFGMAKLTAGYYVILLLNILLIPLAFLLWQETVRAAKAKAESGEEVKKPQGGGGAALAVIEAALVACAMIVILLLIGLSFSNSSGQVTGAISSGIEYACNIGVLF